MSGPEESSCCPPGSLPALTEDDQRTVSGTVDGKLYYVPPPPEKSSSTAGVIVVYDIYGFSGGRIKGVCDAIAAAGFHVCMPDVYDGTELKAKGGFGNPQAMAWLKERTAWPTLSADLAPGFEYLKSKGVTKVGAIGFCWGCYGVVKLSADEKISAGVCAHPSLKIGNMMFGEAEVDQVAAVKCPIAFLPAGNDPGMYKDGSLAKLVEAAGYECVTEVFPDMQHGFVPRGDASLPDVKRDVQKAIDVSTAFFAKHLL